MRQHVIKLVTLAIIFTFKNYSLKASDDEVERLTEAGAQAYLPINGRVLDRSVIVEDIEIPADLALLDLKYLMNYDPLTEVKKDEKRSSSIPAIHLQPKSIKELKNAKLPTDDINLEKLKKKQESERNRFKFSKDFNESSDLELRERHDRVYEWWEKFKTKHQHHPYLREPDLNSRDNRSNHLEWLYSNSLELKILISRLENACRRLDQELAIKREFLKDYECARHSNNQKSKLNISAWLEWYYNYRLNLKKIDVYKFIYRFPIKDESSRQYHQKLKVFTDKIAKLELEAVHTPQLDNDNNSINAVQSNKFQVSSRHTVEQIIDKFQTSVIRELKEKAKKFNEKQDASKIREGIFKLLSQYNKKFDKYKGLGNKDNQTTVLQRYKTLHQSLREIDEKLIENGLLKFSFYVSRPKEERRLSLTIDSSQSITEDYYYTFLQGNFQAWHPVSMKRKMLVEEKGCEVIHFFDEYNQTKQFIIDAYHDFQSEVFVLGQYGHPLNPDTKLDPILEGFKLKWVEDLPEYIMRCENITGRPRDWKVILHPLIIYDFSMVIADLSKDSKDRKFKDLKEQFITSLFSNMLSKPRILFKLLGNTKPDIMQLCDKFKEIDDRFIDNPLNFKIISRASGEQFLAFSWSKNPN